MSSKKIVLFDIDGTLMRGAGPHHKQALIAATKEVMGVECTLDGVDTAGCLDPDLIAVMLINAGVMKTKLAAKMARLIEAAQHHYSVNCKADFSDKLCPGVKSAMEALVKRGIPMGLVTGNLSAIAYRKLENAGIERYFSFGAFAEEAKTRSRLAKLAVAHAKRKAIAADHCSVTLIGDHANDIEAAKANGFRSVAVATGVMSADELRKFVPDLVLQSLEGVTVDLLLQ